MHVTTFHGVVIDALHHLEVGAVHVDGIVHHGLIESVHRGDLALATREVGGIGLCGEVAGIVVAAEAYAETVKRDILTHLCQETHTLGIVYLDILQAGIGSMAHKDTR